MKTANGIVRSIYIQAVARYDFDLDAKGQPGWFKSTVNVRTANGIELVREERGDGPERAIAFALQKMAGDLLDIHPRPER